MRNVEVMEFKAKPLAYLCRSAKSIKEIAEAAKTYSKGTDFLQILDNKKGIAESILPAYLNAKIRYADNIIRSKSIAVEFMLLIANTMQVSKAFDKVAAKNNKGFIAFSTNKRLFSLFRAKTDIIAIEKIDMDFNMKTASKIACVELLESRG